MTEAVMVAPDGVASAVPPDQADRALPDGAFIWIHIDGRDQDGQALLPRLALPETARTALVATETRPRAEPIGDGALLNLRGLARTPEEAPDGLVSIRLWADRGRVVSVSFAAVAAVAEVRAQVDAGRIHDPGDLIAALAATISERLDPEVATLGDTLDACEVLDKPQRGLAIRRRVARARTAAIRLRRFVSPQRQALDRLATLELAWLAADDRLHIRNAADRFARMAEELEAIRERAALIHEQLTDMRSEQIETRALLLSVVALVFLPLTFLTGLFGMNVKDIPLADAPGAFWWITAVCVGTAALLGGYFVRAHWFRS